MQCSDHSCGKLFQCLSTCYLHDGGKVGLDASIPFIQALSPFNDNERRVPPPLLRYRHCLHSTKWPCQKVRGHFGHIHACAKCSIQLDCDDINHINSFSKLNCGIHTDSLFSIIVMAGIISCSPGRRYNPSSTSKALRLRKNLMATDSLECACCAN